MEYDVFISYAKEDRALAAQYAERLNAEGLRVFFAPQKLREDEPRLQQVLLEALRSSASVLLLWSRFVDKSEWVALETSLYATCAASGAERPGAGLVVLDLGGPALPNWLPYDLIIAKAQDAGLEELLATPRWWEDASLERRFHGHSGPGMWRSPLAVAREVFFDEEAWVRRCHMALPRVGPDFALSHLRSGEFARWPARQLIRDSLLAVLLPVTGAVLLSLALWRWVIPFPESYQGYVSKEILFVGCAAIAAALINSVRIGVAAAASASLLSTAAGLVAAMTIALFRRPDPWAGSLTIGITLGATSAISRPYHLRASHTPVTHRFSLWPLLAIASVAALIAGGQMAAVTWADAHGQSTRIGRAVLVLIISSLVFLPVGVAAGWFARFQIRARQWLRAALIGAAIWISLTGIATAIAAYVPFGDPFNWRDGIGVGALSGAAAATAATILLQSVVPITGEAAAPLCTLGIIFSIAIPLLARFPNLHPIQIWVSLFGGAALGWIVVAARNRSGSRTQKTRRSQMRTAGFS